MIQSIQDKTGASIRRICLVVDYPESTYYSAATPTSTQLADVLMGDQIEEIFTHHRRRYGYRRIVEELRDLELTCSPARVRRLMKQRGLHAIQPKNFVPKTSDGRADKPSPNLLADQPLPDAPNQVWAGDITFIPTSHGWCYLAVVIDLYSRKVVGWSLADHMRADLVCEAFEQAVGSRRNTEGLIFHSDRGSQYGSGKFRKQLREMKAQQSMSRRANPYDNAWTESFIGTLKNEMLQNGSFIDESDARTELFAYIDGYYNTHRKHSSLDYLSPCKFEAQFHYKN